MNPLVQRELGLLIVSVSMNLDGTGTLAFDHKHRGIIKIIPFPKLPDAFNTLEHIISTSKPGYKSFSSEKTPIEGVEKYRSFFRLSPSLIMVSAPLDSLPCYGNAASRAGVLFEEVRNQPNYSGIFPLPEELEVAYYKEDNGSLVMVIEDKSR